MLIFSVATFADTSSLHDAGVRRATYALGMRAEPIREPLPAGALAGVELIVEGPRGSWQLEAVDSRRWAITAEGNLVLAVAVDSWWCGATFLRGPGWTSMVPHFSAAESRTLADGEAWLRHFARLLSASPLTGLHTDTWWLLRFNDTPKRRYDYSTRPYGLSLPWPPDPPADFEAVLRFALAWFEAWDRPTEYQPQPRPGGVIPMRRPSLAEDGRVKAWRRALREGVLPPALLLYNPLIERYLVLDGHDRIHAALLEGQVPPTIACYPMTKVQQWHTRKDPNSQMMGVESVIFSPFEKPPSTIEIMNRDARQAYGEAFARPVFSARQFQGGDEAWNQMIEVHLGEQDPELRRSLTIDPSDDPDR